MDSIVPPLLRRLSSDEYLRPADHGERADRHRPAASTSIIDAAAGGRTRLRGPRTRSIARVRRRPCRRSTTHTAAASSRYPTARCTSWKRPTPRSAATRRSSTCRPTSSIPARWVGPARPRSAGFLKMVDPERWPGEVDPARDRRRRVGRARVRRVGDRDRAAHVDSRARGDERVDERADRGRTRRGRSVRRDGPRADAHDRAPEPRSGRAGRDERTGARQLRPSGWKVLHALRTADRRRHPPADGSSTTTRSGSRSSNASTRSARASSRRTRDSAVRFPSNPWKRPRRATSVRPRPRSRTSLRGVPLRLRARSRRRGRCVRRRRTRRRGVDRLIRSVRARRHRTRGQRLRRARQHVVPHVAPAGRSRPRARQAARRARARAHRVGHRLDVVRVTAAADRRVPRVPDPAARCRSSSATRSSPRADKERILSTNAQELYGSIRRRCCAPRTASATARGSRTRRPRLTAAIASAR